jgi:hypothetical protein
MDNRSRRNDLPDQGWRANMESSGESDSEQPYLFVLLVSARGMGRGGQVNTAEILTVTVAI